MFYLGLFLLAALIIGGIIFTNAKARVYFCPPGFLKQDECAQNDMSCLKFNSCVECPKNAVCSKEGEMEC